VKRKANLETGNDMVTLHIKLGLKNTHVSRSKHGKGYYAQFWVDTSEKKLVDFRRILQVSQYLVEELIMLILRQTIEYQSYMKENKSLI
jgi:hypothetical protein